VQLRIHNLTVSYNGSPALKDVTLDVPEGDFMCLLGPNGSGKTTLLRTIAKVLTPTAGAVYLSDKDLRDVRVRDLAQQMSVVPQSDVIDFDFTVEDIVLMGRMPHLSRFASLSEHDWQTVNQAMQATNVTHLRHRLITEVSGGERKRVIIARALAQQPKILLLDEPTSNLDINYQYEIMGLVYRLNAAQRLTVLAVLHQINLASAVAKTILLLNQNGQIHAVGTPEAVITQENIEAVYRTPVLVTPHPLTGKPQVQSGYRFTT
jgi:iron complex transport system ATP-binding protein